MKILFTIFLLFYSLLSHGQVDFSKKVTNFSGTCLKKVFSKDSVDLEIEEFWIKPKKMILQFTVGANCSADNRGILTVREDTLYISGNDVNVKVVNEWTEKDSVGMELHIVEEEITEEYAFCDCKIRYTYAADDVNEKIEFLDFNGLMVKLKNE